jgi:pantothenate kinase type III
MNFIITVDAGNSKLKFSLFNSNGECLTFFDLQSLTDITFKFKLTPKNTQAIISNVTKDEINLPFNILDIRSLFKNKMFLDMPINYNEKLGLDRIAIAYHHIKTKALPALLIDSGTFTTVDTISSKGFEGGYILPGLELIQNSYLRGANLSKAKEDYSSILETPHSTEEAISKGAILTYLSPIERLIKLESHEVTVITGGNSKTLFQYLSKSSPSPLQVDENLIHKALFFIKNMVK